MDIDLSSNGPSEIVLPEPDPALRSALRAAIGREAVTGVAAAHPASPEVWAALGEHTEVVAADRAGQVEAYAYFRVGYHRGLDLLRRHGWKAAAHVRWEHPSNRGFLRCLDGLRRMAGAIGEEEEHRRCTEFLAELDSSFVVR